MPHCWMATLALAALLAGCGGARGSWGAARAPTPDPERWERLACRQGEYPPELDGRALARARYEDLRSRQGGAPSTFATARLESERSAFRVRCAAWRAGDAPAQLASTSL